MKKILFLITRSDSIGGAQIHIRDLCMFLGKDNYKTFVIIGESKEKKYINQLKKIGVNVITTKFIKNRFNLYADIRAVIFIVKNVYSLNPQIISSHSFKAGILLKFASLFIKNTPTLFTAHGWSFTYGIPRLRRIISLLLEKILCKRLNKIITVCKSDYQLALNKKIVKKEKLLNIYNGMPIKSYKCKNFKFHEIINFISIARFEDQKDHKTIIESFSILKDEKWKLYLIGDGPNKKNIERLVEIKGLKDKVFFIGLIENVEEYLKMCDVFILSSFWEGFPRSILEAMRSSLPIISSDVGGCRESVIHEYNGFLFETQNIEVLAYYIKRFIDDFPLIEEFGEKSFNLFKSKFTFQKMYDQTLATYKDLNEFT